MTVTNEKKKSVLQEQDVYVGIGCIDFRKYVLRNALSFSTTELYMLASHKEEAEKIRIVSFTPDWWPLWYLTVTQRI